jgi:hypothetical protein
MSSYYWLYQDQLHKFWASKGYIEKLEKKKKVLREPRRYTNIGILIGILIY